MKRVGVVVLLALCLIATAGGVARAAFQGSNALDNIAPESQLSSRGLLMDRYPSDAWGLDYHVDSPVNLGSIGTSGIDDPDFNMDAAIAAMLHTFSGWIWDVTRAISSLLITAFTWAFSLDLVNREGLLGPVANAMQTLYRDVLGVEWMALVVVGTGAWLIWQAFVKRRVAQSMGALLGSVALVVLALWIVTQPAATVGQVARWSNDLSGAMLSLTTAGPVGDADRAKSDSSDKLWMTLIHEPWKTLEFGGQEHCVDRSDRPVKPKSKACVTQIDHDKYAERFLYFGPAGSKRRAEEYEAIAKGEGEATGSGGSNADRSDFEPADGDEDAKVEPAPVPPRAYRLTEADRPAVDIQQQGGASQRLMLAILIFVGSLGGWLLLGSLVLRVIVAQLFALLLLVFAPVALLAAIVPGVGHAAFLRWGGWLVGALVQKVIFGLILAATLAVTSALGAAAANLGWLLAFGLQSGFWWFVFLGRNKIQMQVQRLLTGRRRTHVVSEPKVKPVAAARSAVSGLALGKKT